MNSEAMGKRQKRAYWRKEGLYLMLGKNKYISESYFRMKSGKMQKLNLRKNKKYFKHTVGQINL